MQGIAQVEEIEFREPVALLKGSKGMELLAGGRPVVEQDCSWWNREQIRARDRWKTENKANGVRP